MCIAVHNVVIGGGICWCALIRLTYIVHVVHSYWLITVYIHVYERVSISVAIIIFLFI